MSTFFIVLFGFLFGFFLVQAGLNKFDTISGLAVLKDFTAAKVVLVALGVGMILFNIEIVMNVAVFHVKDFMPVSQLLGGLLFGGGMALLGYGPGTAFVALGEGSYDALVGIVGGVAGALAFQFVAPLFPEFFSFSLGKMSLFTIIGKFNFLYFAIIIILSILFILIARYLQKIDKSQNKKWVYAGAGLAVLNGLMLMPLVMGKPLGVSSVYPWMGAYISGQSETEWFAAIKTSGDWQIYFLLGALLAGFLLSVFRRGFKINAIHPRWKEFKGSSIAKRLIFAFAGGFLMIFGARMAGGCSCGHILSGGMQLAVSSYYFAVFTLIGLIITGKLFYRKTAGNNE